MSLSFSIPQPKINGPIVVCGPSGCGKSTLLTRLFKEFPDTFAFSVSHTTRKPRPGERNQVDYNFVSREEFEDLIKRNAFIEHAQFSGNRYGTTVKAVEDVESKGKRCVLDIDTQGVRSIHTLHKALSERSLFIFLSPPAPALKNLHSRLSGRGTETQASLKSRLAAAKGEMNFAAQEGNFDIIVVNDDVDTAYEKLKSLALQGKVVKGKSEKGDVLPVVGEEDLESFFA